MGIRPNKSGDLIVNPPDNSQSRWGDWVTGLEGAGDTAGGVVSEIDAKAESANSGSGELAGDLTALEGRVGSLETSPFPQSKITGLVARLQAIEQRLDAAGL